ncbi:nuclear transport factor 2 family protein [Elizabethkingia ursingii]|uniref:nuclear transport factor 2 family protein n=1 Tax=Elizabethkingia ursingii TaxID=1756150 RepID=UPI0020138984|nr:nuclear transport factor 2 family protein [Elizabethkingia ursingii]MCL1668311.1 nuclear transport factor 2 family protein [Elizabethkingia ursingii]
MSKNVEIVQSYFDAVSRGDFAKIDILFADEIVWNQPGNGIQSGIYTGKEEVFKHLGNFMKWSAGTFAIDTIDYLTDNGSFVAASIHFSAEKGDQKLSMKGIDLLRVEDNIIKEVWLFSEEIEAEDDFWNYAEKNTEE